MQAPLSPSLLRQGGTKGHPREILHWTCFLFPLPQNQPHQCSSHPQDLEILYPFSEMALWFFLDLAVFLSLSKIAAQEQEIL